MLSRPKGLSFKTRNKTIKELTDNFLKQQNSGKADQVSTISQGDSLDINSKNIQEVNLPLQQKQQNYQSQQQQYQNVGTSKSVQKRGSFNEQINFGASQNKENKLKVGEQNLIQGKFCKGFSLQQQKLKRRQLAIQGVQKSDEFNQIFGISNTNAENYFQSDYDLEKQKQQERLNQSMLSSFSIVGAKLCEKKENFYQANKKKLTKNSNLNQTQPDNINITEQMTQPVLEGKNSLQNLGQQELVQENIFLNQFEQQNSTKGIESIKKRERMSLKKDPFMISPWDDEEEKNPNLNSYTQNTFSCHSANIFNYGTQNNQINQVRNQNANNQNHNFSSQISVPDQENEFFIQDYSTENNLFQNNLNLGPNFNNALTKKTKLSQYKNQKKKITLCQNQRNRVQTANNQNKRQKKNQKTNAPEETNNEFLDSTFNANKSQQIFRNLNSDRNENQDDFYSINSQKDLNEENNNFNENNQHIQTGLFSQQQTQQNLNSKNLTEQFLQRVSKKQQSFYKLYDKENTRNESLPNKKQLSSTQIIEKQYEREIPQIDEFKLPQFSQSIDKKTQQNNFILKNITSAFQTNLSQQKKFQIRGSYNFVTKQKEVTLQNFIPI